MAVKSTEASSSCAAASSSMVTFGEKEYEAGIGTSLTSFINSRTVMRGAAKQWDPERLQKRIQKLEKIGGEHHFLETRTGDQISSFHFTVDRFHQSLTEMGGQIVSVEVQKNHPFFETTQPVTLTKSGSSDPVPGVRIPYSVELESEFRNPQDFLRFCAAKRYEVVWEDTLQSFTAASWWHWSSRKQNLILIPKIPAKRLDLLETPSSVRVEVSSRLDPYFDFFDKKPMTSRAYVFDKDPIAVRQLLFSSYKQERGLKIENSSWNVAEYQGKLYLVENHDVASHLESISMRGLAHLPTFQVLTTPVRPITDASRATVVLSMNQTDSYVAYSHEILTFLLMGVDVVVYDNAGKGLSKGLNSHQGMVEAVDVVGRYLIEGKGVDPSRVLFKGQCAGGFATSQAMERFGTHGWIDQAPQTFSNTAVDIAEKKADQMAKERGGWIPSLSRIIPYTKPIIKAAASMLLPSYDVVTSFSKVPAEALKIYTIGVPDERGYGGDQLVPVEERDSIQEALASDPNGHYLTITGGTHVTDWWLDPSVFERITDIFTSHSLSVSVFPEEPRTPEEAVRHSYEVFFQKPYDPSAASADEISVFQIFQAVQDQNLEAIESIMHEKDSTPYMAAGLFDRLSTENHAHLVSLAISLSKKLGNQSFTVKLMLAQRRGAI